MKTKQYPIVFKNISHIYESHRVLDHIDLSFDQNLITVILGKSGSGKSTLLQMINGLIRPSVGRIVVFGEAIDYDNIYPLRRSIGYAVQGTGLFPHLTVHQNIALLATVCAKEKNEINKRIDSLMQMVNLDLNFKDRYPHQLSGGEQQRVGICRAMVMDPPIFLLDEAFGALDITTRKELHQELLNLQRIAPRTIVLVTHDVNEAFTLADRILVLGDGKVQQFSDPDTVKKHPMNSFVEQFMENAGK